MLKQNSELFQHCNQLSGYTLPDKSIEKPCDISTKSEILNGNQASLDLNKTSLWPFYSRHSKLTQNYGLLELQQCNQCSILFIFVNENQVNQQKQTHPNCYIYSYLNLSSVSCSNIRNSPACFFSNRFLGTTKQMQETG